MSTKKTIRKANAAKPIVRRRCAICKEKRCTDDNYCYGCEEYVCERCESIFGLHAGTNHPLPKLAKTGIRALVGERLDRQLDEHRKALTEFRIFGAAIVISDVLGMLAPRLQRQLRKSMALAARTMDKHNVA